MWQLLSGVFVLLEITLQASISRDTSYTSPVTLTQPQRKIGFLSTGHFTYAGNKDSKAYIFSKDGQVQMTYNCKSETYLVTPVSTAEYIGAIHRVVNSGQETPTLYRYSTIPMSDPPSFEADIAATEDSFTLLSTSAASYIFEWGAHQKETNYLYFLYSTVSSRIQRLDFTDKGSSVQIELGSGFEGSFDFLASFVVCVSTNNFVILHPADFQTIANVPKPLQGRTLSTIIMKDEMYLTVDGPKNSALYQLNVTASGQKNTSEVLGQWNLPFAEGNTVRSFGGAMNLLAIVGNNPSTICIMSQNDHTIQATLRTDSAYSLVSNAIAFLPMEIVGEELKFDIIQAHLSKSVADEGSLLKYSYRTLYDPCLIFKNCEGLKISKLFYDPDSQIFSLTFNAQIVRKNFTKMTYCYLVGDDGETLSRSEFTFMVHEDDNKTLRWVLSEKVEFYNLKLVLETNVDDPIFVAVNPALGNFTELPIILSGVSSSSLLPSKSWGNGYNVTGTTLISTTLWLSLVFIESASPYRLGISAGLQPGNINFPWVVKGIDILQYFLYYNGERITIMEEFLQPFKVNPMSLWKTKELNAPEGIYCNLDLNFKKENLSCNLWNNYSAKLIFVGIIAVIVAAVVATKKYLKLDSPWLQNRAVQVVLLIPKILLSPVLLWHLVDAIQIETVQYSLINIYYLVDTPTQNFFMVLSCIFLLLYLLYYALLYMYCRNVVCLAEGSPMLHTRTMQFCHFYFQYLFEDYRPFEEIEHNYLFYLPFIRSIRFGLIQLLLVFMAAKGTDQVRLILILDLFLFIAVVWRNPHRSNWGRLELATRLGFETTLELLIVIADYGKNKWTRGGYGVIAVVIIIAYLCFGAVFWGRTFYSSVVIIVDCFRRTYKGEDVVVKNDSRSEQNADWECIVFREERKMYSIRSNLRAFSEQFMSEFVINQEKIDPNSKSSSEDNEEEIDSQDVDKEYKNHKQNRVEDQSKINGQNDPASEPLQHQVENSRPTPLYQDLQENNKLTSTKLLSEPNEQLKS